MSGVSYMGVPLVTGSFDGVADWLIGRASGTPPPVVVTHVNISNFYNLSKCGHVREELQRGCVLFLDGIGLKAGGFLLGLGWLPDLNGTDLFSFVMEKAARRRMGVYLIGSTADAVEGTVECIRKRYAGVRIAGWRNGYFNKEEEDAIVARVNESGAHCLLIGRGFIKQEEFTLRHRDRLRVPLVWNVGGLFDFVSGIKPRAPLLMRRMRLEWLFRLLLEPGRMWRRSFVHAPVILAQVMKYRTTRFGRPVAGVTDSPSKAVEKEIRTDK